MREHTMINRAPSASPAYTIRVRKFGYSVNPWRLVRVLADGREIELYGDCAGAWVPVAFRTKSEALEYALDRYAWYHNLARHGLQAPILSADWRDSLPSAPL